MGGWGVTPVLEETQIKAAFFLEAPQESTLKKSSSSLVIKKNHIFPKNMKKKTQQKTRKHVKPCQPHKSGCIYNPPLIGIHISLVS